MKFISLLTFLLLFWVSEAFAEMSSYNSISAILEIQGRFLAGIFRNFILNEIPAFRLLFGVIVFSHFAFVLFDDHLVDKVTIVTKKFIFFLLVSCAIFIDAPSNEDTDIYSFIEAEESNMANMYQKSSMNSNIPASYPISWFNYWAFSYGDVTASVLYDYVDSHINGSDGNRRMPLLMQRAVSLTRTTPFLTPAISSFIKSYTDECNDLFLSHDQIKGTDATFYDSMRSEYDGINIDNVLSVIYTSITNDKGDRSLSSNEYTRDTLPPEYHYTCLDLRDNLSTEIDRLIRNRNDYFDKLNAKDPSLSGLTDDEKSIIVQKQVIGQFNLIVGDYYSANMNQGYNENVVPGKLLQDMKKLKRAFLTSYIWGTPEAHEELFAFYHKIPSRFGWISTFIQISAEFALILSLVFGRLVWLLKMWFGYFLLKCLPILWMLVDSTLRGFNMIHALGQTQGFGQAENLYDRQLALLIQDHLSGIQEDSIALITYSFYGLLVVFAPSALSYAKGMLSR